MRGERCILTKHFGKSAENTDLDEGADLEN